MSRPVNFYEQAPTGLISGLGINGTVYVNGSGAFIAPFAQNFTGFYLPADFSEGGPAGFGLPYTEDSDIWPTKFSISLIGTQVQGNRDTIGIGSRYSGSMFPLFKDSGYYAISVNGVLSGSNKDITNNYIIISGYINSGNKDNPLINSYISGYMVSGQKEIMNMFSSFSGSFTTGNKEICNFSSSFNGFLIRANKDYLDVNLTLADVSYGVGIFIGHYIETGSDIANINLSLVSVIYSNV